MSENGAAMAADETVSDFAALWIAYQATLLYSLLAAVSERQARVIPGRGSSGV